MFRSQKPGVRGSPWKNITGPPMGGVLCRRRVLSLPAPETEKCQKGDPLREGGFSAI